MRLGKLRSQVHVGHPFHGWLAMAGNHGGRKGGSGPQILDQHAAEVAVLFFQAAHIILPGWGWGQWVLGQWQEIWWGRQGFAMIPKWREGRKTRRAGRCHWALRIGRQWVTSQAQWWWHQWPHMSMRGGRQGAHGTGIKLKGCQVGPAIALLLALALSLLVVIVAVLAVVAVVAAALGVEATSVAGAVEMIGRANGWQLGQPGIIFRAGTHGRSNHRRIKHLE
mmetsp:Transcript_85655/g.135921  ORF Transcript_85655/g.135921 Transcript_85655/m.135921 type:complete len:223 (+) Transcript_85655:144-812(+)